MCGFAGFIDNLSIDRKNIIIKRMSDTIAHRGPDGEGFYTDDTIAMGFRRLSIIDLSTGDQPLYNEDRSLVINFNGEIYNYKELREELIAKGHVFACHADTEVIIHGYEEYGEAIVDKLRGMFAFVIWDNKKKELFGARDPFGIKPFYYYDTPELFEYGSEIKTFLKHPLFKKELNKDALKTYLMYQYSVPTDSFFVNVHKLNPGHCFKYKDGKMNIRQYFKIEYRNNDDDLDTAVDKINSIMKESIEYHKISDVEVGAFLSSGVDSSYIVANANVDKAFTVGFKSDHFDETEDAHALCEILGMKHSRKHITADMFFDILPTVQYHSDEPHANLSAVPLYFLANMASKEVKVVLSGEGADELFGGYYEYETPPEYARYNKLPFGFRRFMKGVAEKLPNMKGRHFLIRAGSTLEESYIGQAFIMNNEEADALLKPAYRSGKLYQDVTRPIFEEIKDKPDLLKKMYLDMHLWLPYDILLKADKMTMANSLELRVPFLDKEVFKVSEEIPFKYIIHNYITKYAFRKAANKTIPEEWAKRKKLGFLVPFREWLKEDKWYEKVKEQFTKPWVSEFFDVDAIVHILDEHKAGRWHNQRKLYTIYAFLIWYEVFFINDGEAPKKPECIA
ncbi:MAG: asparagine synthase (glutamine-hydrolyzing) [Lachnospiraceae bacterium]|jgi:asparagine synthase (glutamine-hydrolysing)|nr:asparagine synthase (glutamine-hydrolyzing) [Lachnospiraceae bacterium]MBR5994279.1 asparagine synthase (glutamine-hydrolyzing) [Lachnospiraceae bacterium]